MRVMLVRPGPLYSVADVHRGLLHGLQELGVVVEDFAYDDLLELYSRVQLNVDDEWKPAFNMEGAAFMAAEHLKARLYQFWPDVVVLTSCFWIPPVLYGVLRARPHHVVAWFTESPYEDDKQLDIAAHVDTVILNDPTNLDEYRLVNPRSYYQPHSYDPLVHRPGPGRPEWACDVAFVGTGFQSRIEFMEKVDWSGIDLRIGGMWKALTEDSPLRSKLLHDIDTCLHNADAIDLYRSAKASFNLYRKEHTAENGWDGWAMGPREVELAATECFFAREPRPEGDRLFPMLPTFTEPEELGELFRWWLPRDDARRDAARAARAAIADRTFKNAAARLLALVEGASRPVWGGGTVTVNFNKE